MKFFAYGHPNIKATHKSTLEITTENYLTPKGDCIIGIKSSISPYYFPKKLKELLLKEIPLKLVLICENFKDEVIFYGSPRLTLKSKISLVIRKSKFIDDRTIGIRANKSAKDINRNLIENLKKGKKLIFYIEPYIKVQTSNWKS